MSGNTVYTRVPNGPDNGNGNGHTFLNVLSAITLPLVLATLVLLIIHMAGFGHVFDQVNNLHTHKLCPAGESCTNGALVGGTGTCNSMGECIGTPKGQCDSGLAPFDFSNGSICRNLTYNFPVSEFSLFNYKICWFGRCIYALEAGINILDWSCAGQDHGRYELKELGAKRCRSFISHDPDAAYFETTLTCVADEPLCLYTLDAPGFNYPYIESLSPPWIVSEGTGAHTYHTHHGDLMGSIETAYLNYKDRS